MAAIGPLTVDGQPVGRWAPFFVFLTATPILVWVAFATKLRAAGKPLPASPQRWPIWEMIAATLAYLAWTFALPNTPFAQNTVRIGIFDGVSGEGLFCRQGSACNASVRRGKETSG